MAVTVTEREMGAAGADAWAAVQCTAGVAPQRFAGLAWLVFVTGV